MCVLFCCLLGHLADVVPLMCYVANVMLVLYTHMYAMAQGMGRAPPKNLSKCQYMRLWTFYFLVFFWFVPYLKQWHSHYNHLYNYSLSSGGYNTLIKSCLSLQQTLDLIPSTTLKIIRCGRLTPAISALKRR